MFAVPDQFVVFVNFLDPVQRYGVDYPVIIHNLDEIAAVRREDKLGKRDPDYFRQNPVVIADHKIATSKLLVPANAAEQVMDGDHCQFLCCGTGYKLLGPLFLLPGATTLPPLS